MFVQAFTVLLPFALQATASLCQQQAVVKTTVECPSVHIVGVRGTMEEPGFGAMDSLVKALMKRIPDSDGTPIVYPATGISVENGELKYSYLEYRRSQNQGYKNLTAELKSFHDKCPETGVVLLGYSQGGHVVGDTLCGCTNPLFVPKRAIVSPYSDSIVAVIQLGDPTNYRNMPWHAGNSTQDGLFPRINTRACNKYEDKWQSFCDDDDIFCDQGKSIEAHLHYVDDYESTIVNFVAEKVSSADHVHRHDL